MDSDGVKRSTLVFAERLNEVGKRYREALDLYPLAKAMGIVEFKEGDFRLELKRNEIKIFRFAKSNRRMR